MPGGALAIEWLMEISTKLLIGAALRGWREIGDQWACRGLDLARLNRGVVAALTSARTPQRLARRADARRIKQPEELKRRAVPEKLKRGRL